jgi:hypothetical protein
MCPSVFVNLYLLLGISASDNYGVMGLYVNNYEACSFFVNICLKIKCTEIIKLFSITILCYGLTTSFLLFAAVAPYSGLSIN